MQTNSVGLCFPNGVHILLYVNMNRSGCEETTFFLEYIGVKEYLLAQS